VSTQQFQDLVTRRPVWVALSDLFLDTDIAPMLEALAHKLAAAPYSIEELEHILYREVYPACAANLRSVAGVWDGFDERALEQRILASQHPLPQLLNRFALRFFRSSVSEDWLQLKQHILAIRKYGISLDRQRSVLGSTSES